MNQLLSVKQKFAIKHIFLKIFISGHIESFIIRRLLGKHDFRTRGVDSTDVYLRITKHQAFDCDNRVRLPDTPVATRGILCPYVLRAAGQGASCLRCLTDTQSLPRGWWPTSIWPARSLLGVIQRGSSRSKASAAALLSHTAHWLQSVFWKSALGDLCNSDNALCGRGFNQSYISITYNVKTDFYQEWTKPCLKGGSHIYSGLWLHILWLRRNTPPLMWNQIEGPGSGPWRLCWELLAAAGTEPRKQASAFQELTS